MPVKSPGSELGKTVKFKKAASVMRGKGRKSVVTDLNLTSLIDMFVLLILFLLMTFSASGEILFVQRDIELPKAANWKDLSRAPVIAVTSPKGKGGSIITMDGKNVVSVSELVIDKSYDLSIPELTQELEKEKSKWKMTHPNEKFLGQVIIHSDKSVDFKVLKRVLYSCTKAGYPNMNFAVNTKPKSTLTAPTAPTTPAPPAKT